MVDEESLKNRFYYIQQQVRKFRIFSFYDISVHTTYLAVNIVGFRPKYSLKNPPTNAKIPAVPTVEATINSFHNVSGFILSSFSIKSMAPDTTPVSYLKFIAIFFKNLHDNL